MMADGFHPDILCIVQFFVVVWTTIFACLTTSLASCHPTYSSYAAFSSLASSSSSSPRHHFHESRKADAGHLRNAFGNSLDLMTLTAAGNFEPYFVSPADREMTAPSGGRAYLRCQVMQLGDRTVSWVRQNDLQILTAGNYTYTSDQRFRPLHSPSTNDWTLEIREVTREDSGVYECQVPSFNDSKLSLGVKLKVVEVKTIVQQGPLVVSPKGSDVRLTCAINYAPQEESHVLWSRDNKLLNYDTSGRWFVWTEKLINDSLASSITSSSASTSSSKSSSATSSVSSPILLSHLLIKNPDSSDSGNYSCQIHAPTIDSSNSHPAHVQVHVLNGKENPAAIHGSGSTGRSTSGGIMQNNSAASSMMRSRKVFFMSFFSTSSCFFSSSIIMSFVSFLLFFLFLVSNGFHSL